MGAEFLFLKNGRLINGRSREPIEDGGVLIEGSKIVDAGRTSDLPLPEKGKVKTIDVSGKTIMPGMVDAHFHSLYWELATTYDAELRDTYELATLKAAKNVQIKLEMGFTSVRDVGCRGNMAVALRDAISLGIIQGPRMRASGQIITSTGGLADWLPPQSRWENWKEGLGVVVDGIDEVIKAVRRQIKNGVDNIKLEASGTAFNPYSPPKRATMSCDELTAAVQEAHKASKTVAIHAEATEGVKNAARAGGDTVEHGMFLDDECIKLLKENDIVLIPTLGCYTSYVEKGPEAGLSTSVVEEHKKNHEEHIESFQRAHEAGVRIAVGTDSGGTFFPHQRGVYELELFVKYGFTEMEAIMATTKIGAEAIGLGEFVGTLEKGKLADLLVVDGDPQKDIRILQDKNKISMIMKGGRLIKNI